MNKFKKPLIFLLILALFTACILTLAGCGGNGETGISISSKSAHKKVYVQGQELNLDGGILTVITDGEEASLPFTAEGVTVTGYDPSKLGRQTLTVSYKDKSATFDIEVVARAVAEGYEKDYFVDEKFNSLKGKVKITRDNGSSFTVAMNSRSISVKEFNTKEAGTTTVTVTYKDENGASYDCSFNVNVHKVASVTFTPPYKTEYKSHEESLDLAGGYLKVVAEAPSSLSKFVDITSSMISGFKPSLATKDNIDTPLEQNVTITYGGAANSFKVYVYYSGVYVMNDAAEVLKSIDWTADNPTINNDEALVAIKAMEEYFKLEDGEKRLVDEDTLETVLRPAVVSLYGKYLEESVSFEDAFTISMNGQINLTGKTRDGVAQAAARLLDENDIFNKYASLAQKIRDEFSSFKIKDEMTVAKYLITHAPADSAQLVEIFNYMIKISDMLKDVPSNWTVETLDKYADDIVYAVNFITTGNFTGVSYSQLYFAVSEWRGGDYLDILYSYYYYVKVGGRDEIQKTLWGKLPAPGMLADWYSAFTSALREEQTMEYGINSGAYLYDVSGFMYYYTELLRLSEKVLAEGDELSRGLYELLSCDSAINSFLRSAKFGYIFQMGEALDYERVVDVWNMYLKLIGRVMTENPEKVTDVGEDIEALFEKVMTLSPVELHTFLSSVNFLYGTSGGTVLVFDYTARPYSMLVQLFAVYYEEVLPETITPIFRRMLLAAENISLIGVKKNAFDEYITYMGEIAGLFGGLSDNDKGEFRKYFNDVYAYHTPLYNNVLDDSNISFGSLEYGFDEMIGWFNLFDKVLNDIAITEDQAKLNKLVPLAIALFEKINEMYESVRGGTDEVAMRAMMTKLYYVEGLGYTIEKRYFAARDTIVTLLITSGVTDANGKSIMSWDAYSGAGANVKKFIVEILPMLIKEYEGFLAMSDIYELAEHFRALTPEEKNSFYLLGINVAYYAALEMNLEAKLSADNKKYNTENSLISKILSFEIACAQYQLSKTGELLESVKRAAAEIEKLISEIPDAENAKEYLAPIYESYLEYVKELQ